MIRLNKNYISKILAILVILSVAGVARSHYKVKRMEAKLEILEEEILNSKDEILFLKSDLRVIIDRLSPDQETLTPEIK